MKMEDEEARKGNETLSALFLLFLEFFSLQNLITNHEFVVIHSLTDYSQISVFWKILLWPALYSHGCE